MTDIADKPEIKLPLFGYVGKLAPLPGQDQNRMFAVANNITPAPEGSAGYLAELTGKRRCKILAWLRGGGDAFACDEPLSAIPERAAEVYMRLDSDTPDQGDVFSRVGGEPRVVAHVQQFEKEDYRKRLSRSVADLGPYADKLLDTDDALAVAFLAFYQFPLERGDKHPWRTVADLLDELMNASYPDALDALMYRGSSKDASPFERFAACSLEAAGAERIRAIAARKDISLRRPSSTNLFWTAHQDVTDEELDVIQAVEGALNRLALLDRALSSQDEGSPKLSAIPENALQPMTDTILTRLVSAAIPARIRDHEDASEFFSIYGTTCARGDEWDVRTRFAAAAERLLVPFNFHYTFDCDVANGVIEVRAALPAVSSFPAVEPLTSAQARSTYALRFSALLASVAFGASVGIVRARVVLRERTLSGDPLLALTFSRRAFVMGVVPCVGSEHFEDTARTPDELLALLEPVEQELNLSAEGGLTPVEVAPLDLGPRPAIADDTRELPESLAALLHADRVCDLDIFDGSDDALRARLSQVFESHEPGDPSAVPEFVDIIAAYDAAAMLANDGRTPLYCGNMVSRVLAGASSDDTPEAAAPVRFCKVPDGAFDARSVLARTYRDLGNYEDAQRLGHELVEMAPTTFSAWHSLALGYHENGQHAEAARMLIEGLKVASAPMDVSAAYYRLAFMLWQAGDAHLGLACYVMVHPGSQFAPMALEEMHDLMRQEHIGTATSRSEAEAALRANGIPLAPIAAVRERVAAAAIGLVDAGFITAGEHLALFLSSLNDLPNGPDVLMSVSRSLEPREG